MREALVAKFVCCLYFLVVVVIFHLILLCQNWLKMVIVQSCQEFKNYTQGPCSYHEFVPCRALYIYLQSLHVMVCKWCQPTSSFAVRPVVLVTFTNEARLRVVERRMIRMMCGIVSTIDKKKLMLKLMPKMTLWV